MSLHVNDIEDLGAETPQPVDADSIERGTFAHLERGQGAVSASQSATGGAHHAREATPQPVSKRATVIIIAGALVAIAVITILFVRILSGGSTTGGEVIEQTVVGQDEAISYRGSSYALVSNGDAHALAETPESGDGEQVLLGDVPGTPVSLVLFDGALIIPENLSDGRWDVVAYTIGSGWSNLVDADGNPCGGEGTIEEAHLDGTNLQLTVDGQPVTVSLV